MPIITKSYNNSGYTYRWNTESIVVKENPKILGSTVPLSLVGMIAIEGTIQVKDTNGNNVGGDAYFHIWLPLNDPNDSTRKTFTNYTSYPFVLGPYKPPKAALYSHGYRIAYSLGALEFPTTSGYTPGVGYSILPEISNGIYNFNDYFSKILGQKALGISLMGSSFSELGYVIDSSVGVNYALIDIYDGIFNRENMSPRPYKFIAYGDSNGAVITKIMQEEKPYLVDSYGFLDSSILPLLFTANYAGDAMYLIQKFIDSTLIITNFTSDIQMNDTIGKLQDLAFAFTPEASSPWNTYDSTTTNNINVIASGRIHTNAGINGPLFNLDSFYINYNIAQRIRGILSGRHPEYISAYTDFIITPYINTINTGLESLGLPDICPCFIIILLGYISGQPLKSDNYDGITLPFNSAQQNSLISTTIAILQNVTSISILAGDALRYLEFKSGGRFYDNTRSTYFSERLDRFKPFFSKITEENLDITYSDAIVDLMKYGLPSVSIQNIDDSLEKSIADPLALEKLQPSYKYNVTFFRTPTLIISRPTIIIQNIYDPVSKIRSSTAYWRVAKKTDNTNLAVVIKIPYSSNKTSNFIDRKWSTNIISAGTNHTYTTIANLLNFLIPSLFNIAEGLPVKTVVKNAIDNDTSHTIKLYEDIINDFNSKISSIKTNIYNKRQTLDNIFTELNDKRDNVFFYRDIIDSSIVDVVNDRNIRNTKRTSLDTMKISIDLKRDELVSKRIEIDNYYDELDILKYELQILINDPTSSQTDKNNKRNEINNKRNEITIAKEDLNTIKTYLSVLQSNFSSDYDILIEKNTNISNTLDIIDEKKNDISTILYTDVPSYLSSIDTDLSIIDNYLRETKINENNYYMSVEFINR